ncbi:MAG: DNA-processing protein DprA [Muribaculaceae bacterium]|nr:DNA-processing protein DprA [Muribaculaceae bacterium]
MFADSLTYRIAFASYRSITLEMARRFEGLGVTPETFFTRPARELAGLTGVRAEYFSDRRRSETLERAVQEAAFVRANGINAIYYTDSTYPARLLECNDAPAMLYLTGSAEAAAARHCVAVVGTRHCTHYGADFTHRLVSDLASGLDSLLIISGLAYGIDICAHRAAISCGIPTGAIVAHGLNTIYPSEHRSDARTLIREGGFIATEYPSWSTIHRGNFLARNRIVAAMADVAVIVESDLRGGAMATARIAGAYNREVMALPGRVNDTYSRGCNELIVSRQASMIRDAADLTDIMGWTLKAAPGTQQELMLDEPDEYRRVLDALRANPDMTANEMCVALGMPYAELSALLFRMELDDFIVALPGNRYALPAK